MNKQQDHWRQMDWFEKGVLYLSTERIEPYERDCSFDWNIKSLTKMEVFPNMYL